MEGEGWKEVNRRCSREEEDEGPRGVGRGGEGEREERELDENEGGGTKGKSGMRREEWEIAADGEGILEVKSWKCSMAVGNR